LTVTLEQIPRSRRSTAAFPAHPAALQEAQRLARLLVHGGAVATASSGQKRPASANRFSHYYSNAKLAGA